MGAVQDMVGREGGLLDHAEGRDEDANRPRTIDPDQSDADAAATARRWTSACSRRCVVRWAR